MCVCDGSMETIRGRKEKKRGVLYDGNTIDIYMLEEEATRNTRYTEGDSIDRSVVVEFMNMMR